MKVEMLKTANGASDGINVIRYVEGRIYDIPESLANIFISGKLAKKASESNNEPSRESKAVIPETKNLDYDNKKVDLKKETKNKAESIKSGSEDIGDSGE